MLSPPNNKHSVPRSSLENERARPSVFLDRYIGFLDVRDLIQLIVYEHNLKEEFKGPALNRIKYLTRYGPRRQPSIHRHAHAHTQEHARAHTHRHITCIRTVSIFGQIIARPGSAPLSCSTCLVLTGVCVRIFSAGLHLDIKLTPVPRGWSSVQGWSLSGQRCSSSREHVRLYCCHPT